MAVGSTSNKAKAVHLAKGDFGTVIERRNQIMEFS